MESPAQEVKDYFVWQPPGKSVVVRIHVDVVDRLSGEVIRGFGAVPKRGAEVGGILIGTLEKVESTLVVWVKDFEPVPCAYKRGPSYLLSESDTPAFEDACRRWAPQEGREAYAVGYFRSQTREGMKLVEEDIRLMDLHFPSPAHVMLLIKPYATKPSVAAFFVREQGVFPETAQSEFPFRRRDLTGEPPPARRALMERLPRGTPETPSMTRAVSRSVDQLASFDRVDLSSSIPAESTQPSGRTRPRTGWVWIPLSFIFFLFGAVMGFLVALEMMTKPDTHGVKLDDYALSLNVSKSDGNLTVKWDRHSPAIRAAQRGSLEIQDGKFKRTVPLDPAGLEGGSIIYNNTSDSVEFRLTVYPPGKVSLSETADWNPAPPPAPIAAPAPSCGASRISDRSNRICAGRDASLFPILPQRA